MFRSVYMAVRNVFTHFWSSRNGNVAMMFAAVSVPLILATGGAIDYARVWAVQSKMQDAADATATMLSKDAPNMTAADIQSKASAFFLANFNPADASGITVSPTYTSVGPSVTVKATANVQAYFLPLIGIDEIPLHISSTAVWGQSRLRVALVLDNTGSMASDGKLDALKTAAKNLLKQLKAAAYKDGDVYVSIIPFVKDVNAGASNYNASWLRWDLWDEVNGSCSQKKYTDKSSCEAKGKKWTADNHTTWNGCVTDRDMNYDTLNSAPTNSATRFPTEQYASCPTQLTGLTYNWNALNTLVDGMSPNGNTNQAIGLQWGWQTLTQSPFTVPAYDPAYQYQKIIILLTDGMNTEDRWYTNSNLIDAREKLLCQNIKADGISMFTVQVNTGHDPTSQMLKDCASSADQTFLLTKADQIVTTFAAIGTALSQLRISK